MRPSQIIAFLEKGLPAGIPTLIVGPPGIGKTAITEDVAEMLGWDLIYSDIGTSDSTRVEGMPWINQAEKVAEFFPFGDLNKALKATKPTVWVFDDIGWAPISTQNSVAHLIHERRTPTGERLPDCVVAVGTTNRRTDKSGVAGMSMAVASRFGCILEMEAHIDDFTLFADRVGIPQGVTLFLRYRRPLLHDFHPGQDIKNFPCPRTWHKGVSKIVELGLPGDVELGALQGAVGDAAAAEFYGFLKIFRQLPDLDGIILNPQAATIPEDAHAKYATCSGLVTMATPGSISRIITYGERLRSAGSGEITAFMMSEIFRSDKDRQIQQTQAWMTMMASPMGQSFRG